MWKQPPPSHLITLTLLYYQFAVGIAFNAVHNRNVQRTTERSVLSSPSLLTAAYDTNAPTDYHHGYKRDPIDDTRINDEAAVHALLAERSEARQNRAFGVADALRDQLLNEYGVRVSDSQRIWRSGCNPSSGSGMNPKWGAAQTTAPAAAGRRTNHDYIYCPTAGPFHCTDLSIEAVHAALAERLDCKLRRHFREADAIQRTLEEAGVYIHDRRREWRADGVMFPDERTKATRYTQAPASADTPHAAVIQERVEQRAAARKAKDYPQADDIQQALRTDYDVEINDQKYLWTVGGMFEFTRNADYRPSSRGIPNEAAIQALVEARAAARKIRDFDLADELRQQLDEEYGVHVNDKLRQWTVRGDGQPFREAEALVTTANPALAAEIQALVEQRDALRKDRQFAAADAIQTALQQNHNVHLNDRQRLWRITQPTLRGTTGGLTDTQVATVQSMLRKRSAAKSKRQFGLADTIRDALRTEFGVGVDDRDHSWRVAQGGEYAADPNVVQHLDAETVAMINEQVQKRAVAKLNKEYDVADDIRDMLLENHDIFIDDKKKFWTIKGTQLLESSETPSNANAAESPEEEEEEVEDPSPVTKDSETSTANEEDVTPSESLEDLTTLTVMELKEKLRAAGLPVSGVKATLVERLSQVAC